MSGNRKVDMTDKVINGITVVSEHTERIANKVCWNCVCHCGTPFKASGDNLRNGNTKSCGCLQKKRTSEAKKTHGESYQFGTTREYRIWSGMKSRCFNPNGRFFSRYGGRGITVCSQWVNSFETFLADMGRCPDDYSIDRIDNDGDYTPTNCRWSSKTEQSRNRSSNLVITCNGISKLSVEWAEEIGLSRGTIESRLARGWSHCDAISPIKKVNQYK